MPTRAGTHRLTVLAREIAAPIAITIILLVLVETVLRADRVVKYIDDHRPAFGEGLTRISARVNIERQLWHLERLLREPATTPRIAFIGSSSVVNGIDESLSTALLAEAGLPYSVRNLGMGGLIASELPSVAHYVFTANTQVAVYLYNGFSLGDAENPDALDARWNTREALLAKPISVLEVDRLALAIDRAGVQQVWLLRFKNLLRTMLIRWLEGSGRLTPLAHPYEYDPSRRAAPERHPRPLEAAAPRGISWLRDGYLESSESTATSGFRGLRRFCELARANGTKLIVAPVPEADYGRVTSYQRDVDFDAIDRNARQVAESCGATFLPRWTEVEARDDLFLDWAHMDANGRRMFTGLMSSTLARALR